MNADDARMQRTRERAYFLWLHEGCPEGMAETHWNRARAMETASAEAEQIDEELRESFLAGDPPSHGAITGVGRP
jgi:hypothetical protein